MGYIEAWRETNHILVAFSSLKKRILYNIIISHVSEDDGMFTSYVHEPAYVIVSHLDFYRYWITWSQLSTSLISIGQNTKCRDGGGG